MKISKVFRLVLWTAILSCSKSGEINYESESIIGENNLHTEKNLNYLGKVGALTNGNTKCTAFLTGTSEITTAAHCIDASQIKAMKFQLVRDENSYTAKLKNLNKNNDFATLEVNHNFASYFTFSTLKAASASIIAFDFLKNEIVTHISCKVKRDINYKGLLVHECDSLPGMSGAPLVQNGEVVGIHLGSLPMKNANGALEAMFRNNSKVAIPNTYIKDEGIFGKCAPWCDNPKGPLPTDPTTEEGNALGKVTNNAARIFGVSSNLIERTAEKVDTFAKSIKIPERSLYEAYITSIFLMNGAACIVSGTTTPGFAARTDPGMVYCSANACLCAFGAATMIYQRNQYFIEHGGVAEAIEKPEYLNNDQFVNAASDISNHREGLVAALGVIPEGLFGVPNGGIYWSNGSDAYCYIPSPKYVDRSVYEYKVNALEMSTMRRDGTCPGMT